ncbi:MAG: hypothetical protein N2561_10145 [Bacteroidetes bacterium]|nr:hypothetical protein [Rhodothermia bacterium]MCS7155293.1 hypothetical protein [Bacteroidota bacterium]MCX7907878.1 hypothetical protein [Bacteroidota bacterium]MDW8138697.1 hypothetical protein [Bacteroidota bacterium]MDW8284717.1 hypothetical protein [Bacteroidota bacterium]
MPTAREGLNFVKEAFLLPWNLGFLAAAGAWTFFNPQWFEATWTLVAGLELLYLGLLSRSRRFQRWVETRRGRLQRPLGERELLLSLDRERQRRFVSMRKLLETIEAQYTQYSGPSRALLAAHGRKLEALLGAYLRLLVAEHRYATYLSTHAEGEILGAIRELEASIKDDPPKMQQLKGRRLEVLRKRLERYQQAREQVQIVHAQLETIEDVFRFVHEQALTMRDPEAVELELDNLLEEVQETEGTVKAMEALFAPLALPSEHAEEDDSKPLFRRNRTRVR